MFVRQRVNLDLFTGNTLGVPDDEAFISEDSAVTEGFVGKERLFPLHHKVGSVRWDGAFADEGP